MAIDYVAPRFEQERFVPAYPRRLAGETFGFFQQLGIIHAATENPLATLSERAFREPVVHSSFMGYQLYQVADPQSFATALLKIGTITA